MIDTLTQEDRKALDTWKSPRGLMISDHNTAIVIDAVTKKFGGRYTHANLNQVALTEPGLIYESGFSPAEKAAVWQAWWAQAPKQLLREQANVGPLIGYVEQYCGGVWSIPNFTAAYEAVKAQLKHTPVKTLEEIQQDFATREKQRIERERLENQKTFDPGARAKQQREESAAKDAAKHQAEAQHQIEELINQWTVNGLPGRTDWEKTEEGRKALRGIRIQKGGKYDAALTLRVVRRAYMFERAADIIREAERAKNDLIDAMNVKPDRGIF